MLHGIYSALSSTDTVIKRFGNAVTSTGTLNLRHSSFAEDFSPVDRGCGCVCCRSTDQGGLGITRAYLYHVAAKETAGAHLYASFLLRDGEYR